jgi:hypothetical protein
MQVLEPWQVLYHNRMHEYIVTHSNELASVPATMGPKENG